jgi:hypothetical protein
MRDGHTPCHLPKGTAMASRGKKKTTMAKLNREAKLRDRKIEKQARKDARKQAAEERPAQLDDELGVAER